MGEPDKPPWLFYFYYKAMDGIRGLFYFNEKRQKGTGCQQIAPQSERIRRNYKKETELDEFEKT